MSRYSAGGLTPGINTADRAYFQLRPTGTTERLYVVEIGIGIAVAPTTAPAPYLARSTAIGTNTLTLAGQSNDPADGAAVGTLDITLGTQPTFVAASKFRVGGLPVTAGSMLIWTFYDKPLIVDRVTTTGLCIANANASGATLGSFFAYMAWDE